MRTFGGRVKVFGGWRVGERDAFEATAEGIVAIIDDVVREVGCEWMELA